MTFRCLIAGAAFAPEAGGIARVARLSGAVLARSGRSVTAVSYLGAAGPGLPFPVSSAGGNRFRFASMVHAGALRADLVLYDSAGMARARPRLPGLRRPFAVWMHGFEAWESLRPGAAAALRQADLVLVNSRYTLDRFERLHGPLPRARVCWLGTEDADMPASGTGGPLADPPTVLILGRIEAGEAYKGHRELIEAWPAVAAAVPRARLVIAGGGSGLADIGRLAAQSPAASGIEVLGFVPQDAIEPVWRRASVLAMPSRGEGFGLVYVEAMRRGLPVIASVHDAGQEVNAHGESGFNVDLDRDGDLCRHLVALLSDDGLRRRMGEAGRERWRTHFSFAAFQGRFLPLFAEFEARA